MRALIDFDDVNYDEQAGLLYDLADQVVAHLRKTHGDDDRKIRNVLLYHQHKIADLIHAQMQKHTWQEQTSFEAKVSQGFAEPKPQSFSKLQGDVVRPFDKPVANAADIPKLVFGGFKKCLYAEQKFDSDPERRFAELLEREKQVIKWFKPGKGDFQIRYTPDHDYEPDFVVETVTEKFLCEPKRADLINDETVRAKAASAREWCKNASAYELAHNGKRWRYALIPHSAIGDNLTLGGVLASYADPPEKLE